MAPREQQGAGGFGVPDGQLGDINQMYSSMQLGTLEMGYFGLGAIVLLKGAEPMNIAYVPYLFKSKESSVKVLKARVLKIYDDIDAKDRRCASWAPTASAARRAADTKGRSSSRKT